MSNTPTLATPQNTFGEHQKDGAAMNRIEVRSKLLAFKLAAITAVKRKLAEPSPIKMAEYSWSSEQIAGVTVHIYTFAINNRGGKQPNKIGAQFEFGGKRTSLEKAIERIFAEQASQ